MSDRAQALEQRGCCAHSRVSYRTEGIECGATRGWWECDSGCGTKFGLVEAPAVGISPQLDERVSAFVDGVQWWLMSQSGHTLYPSERDDAEAEAVDWYKSTLVSPVEPTPEPPSCEANTASNLLQKVEPAQCVWRTQPDGYLQVGCKPDRCISEDFHEYGPTHCLWCGHPLKIEGRTP